jgi:LPS export ABC transporter protein LptC
MSPRSTVWLTLLIAAAIGSWYLSRKGQVEDAKPMQTDQVYRGYYLKTARILGTGSDGSLLYEIEAEHAEQQSDNRIEFSDVHIRYSPDSDVPWTVDADMATIYADEQRVLLEGHVRAISAGGFAGSETEIRTQTLHLDPDNYVAETEERVQIRIGSRSLTATGMLASLKDDRLELKSNVNGKFVP